VYVYTITANADCVSHAPSLLRPTLESAIGLIRNDVAPRLGEQLKIFRKGAPLFSQHGTIVRDGVANPVVGDELGALIEQLGRDLQLTV